MRGLFHAGRLADGEACLGRAAYPLSRTIEYMHSAGALLVLATSHRQDRATSKQSRMPCGRFFMAAHKFLWPALACWALTCAQALAQPQPGADFPPGPGRDTVVAVCGGCHEVNRVKAGYNAAGWNMIQHMMENMGAPVPPEDWPAVTAYL